jgi:hypothetical protein
MLSSLTTPMWKGRNLLTQTQEALESGAREPSGQGYTMLIILPYQVGPRTVWPLLTLATMTAVLHPGGSRACVVWLRSQFSPF